MKKQQKGMSTGPLYQSLNVVRHYWVGLAFVALFGLAVAAPSAEAAPMPQLTVPTATPTPFIQPDSSNDNDDNNNNSSNTVIELFEEPTPEPLFNPDFEQTFGQGSEDLGGGFAPAIVGVPDDLFEESSVEASAPILEPQAPIVTEGFEGLVGTSFLNIFSNPDPNSDIIDTLFRDTPVQIISRNETGEWVLICCGEERGNRGWVPASDINFGFDFGNPDVEMPVFGSTPLIGEEPILDLELGANGLIDLEAEIAELDLAMSVESGNIKPGDEVELLFWVTNVSEVDAVDVSLRNELPNILEFESASFLDAALTETANARNNDAPVFRIDWPELAAGETVTATVFIQVSEDADYGLVVDNLAGVGATNAKIETAGVTFGTPPIFPPDFRSFR